MYKKKFYDIGKRFFNEFKLNEKMIQLKKIC